jgi:hypothetical protein
MLVHLKKNIAKSLNLNSVGSTQFSLNPASEIKNATISEWSYPGRHLTSYLNSKHSGKVVIFGTQYSIIMTIYRLN